jgi:hypothetical protein
MMCCQSCGAEAPLKQVSFHQNVGLLIVRFHSHVTGQLCRRCIDREFWQRTLVTLFFGPWGIISLIFTPIILAGNVAQYLGALSLPRAGASVPMSATSSYGSGAADVSTSPFSGRTKWIALGVLSVSVLGCCGSCFGMFGFGQWLQSRVAPLAAVCNGGALATAAPLTPSPGIAVMEHEGTSWRAKFNVLASAMNSVDTAFEAALVLCIEPHERVEIERCDYTNGGTIVRYRVGRRARLVEARTGRSLSEQVVTGPDPARCGEWSQVTRYEEWDGTDPIEDQETWSRAFASVIPH